MDKSLVYKINDINVILLEEGSSLDVTYNYQEFNQVGGDKTGDNKSGVVPLGKASATLSFSFFPENLEDNNALFSDIIENQGEQLKIDDIYLGTLYAYILSARLVNSPRVRNRPVYNIKVNLISGNWVSTLNIKSDIEGLESLEKGNLLDDIHNLKAFLIKTGNPITEVLKKDILDPISDLTVGIKSLVDNGGRAFFDSSFNLLFSSLQTAFLATSIATDVLERANQTVNSINDLMDSFKQLKQFPNDFYDLLIKTIDNAVSVFKKNEKKPIYKPILNHKEVNNEDFLSFGNLLQEELGLQKLICLLLNRVALLMDIKKLLLGGFNNQDELNNLVNNIKNIYNFLDYEGDEIVEYQSKIEEYSLNINLSNLKTINIDVKGSLLRIIYNIYGNLECFDDIVTINNIKDINRFEGTLLIL